MVLRLMLRQHWKYCLPRSTVIHSWVQILKASLNLQARTRLWILPAGFPWKMGLKSLTSENIKEGLLQMC